MVPGKEEFKKEYLESVAQTCSTPFAETTLQEKYTALASLINDCCSALRRRRSAGGRGTAGKWCTTFPWSFWWAGFWRTI